MKTPESKASKPQNPAILFDLDGTLIDTAYEHVLAWSSALRSAGMVIPSWKIHRRIGMSGRSLIQQLLREHPSQFRKIDVKQLEKKHDAEFTKALNRLQPLPGAEKLLHALTRFHVPWAIATTGNRKQTRRLLRLMHLPSKIVFVTGDDVAKAKPSPDVFIAAADELKVPIDQCIVVGDSVWDMLAGGRRRALCIGLLSGGYSKEELEQSGAFRVYSDPAAMLEHIEDLGIG
ncbi:MAG TPA: HAD family hydrolase [Candidatus Deferrimicrobiaceae bacterium]|nr:HAD family hydrolase [Candidatus Deferrimicrobiaceae bacterium]